MTYSYTNDSVDVVITSVGSFLATTSTGAGVPSEGCAGRVFKQPTAVGLLCINTATPAGSVMDAGWAMTPNLQKCVTKAAISASDLVMKAGRAFTLDGRAYCSTPAAGVGVARYIERLPYTAAGALKINEK